MRLLVTAGVTQVPIDQVRVITSVFTGRTGTRIALEANRRGHEVTLLTSAPQLVGEQLRSAARWHVKRFRTFDELHDMLAELVPRQEYDVIIHSAAVSDYRVANVYVPNSGNVMSVSYSDDKKTGLAEEALDFAPLNNQPKPCSTSEHRGRFVLQVAPKISSMYGEVWLRLVPTPKLVDQIRRDWGFQGVLVKFKLEAGVSEETLLARAEASRINSAADLMVANLLESVATTAWLGPLAGQYRKLSRQQLAPALLDAVESLVGCKR
ncbi:MAG: phosphopantothenoylcysteine decarboxylase [Gemmatales bacterium]|nr:bifunctional phosphopantothenoylcysteine decarboxylase/phosphopantothenate synthase [Gemmatales bacterium]MDW7994934.1 phosphopantothenoylcysteine decarboxylase [Gemmatales bacterium]